MSKENIKANVVEAPTLFVGVGGTGCKIIRGVAEMCQPGETDNVNFVGLDTNVNDLSTMIQSQKRIYYVQTSNTQTVGNYLDYDKDALDNWFPKNAVLYDKTVSEGAGQVRAISRLALNSAIKVGKLNPLHDAIDDLFRKSGNAMQQAMRCIMVSTASGGTGSGIILPLSMYIRDYVKNKYPNTSLIVRSLIMLPETLDSVIESSVERESQRRNAYATIKEINAFMMKGSGFFDISDELKRYENLHIDITDPGTDELRPLDLLPCDFCFLLDGQNAQDNTLVSLPQYIKQASQALYEQNIGPMQKKAFSVEDNIIKEMSNPGNFGRNRFGGIGASVIRYPYEDVADYIAYDWAISSIGGEGEAAKWSYYDNQYKIKHAEDVKRGLAETEMRTKAEVYTSTLKSNKNAFSKDLRNKFLSDDSKRIKKYFDELAKAMHACLSQNSYIKNTRDAVDNLKIEIDYSDESMRGQAVSNKEGLRAYEFAVQKYAQKAAESYAESIIINEKATILEDDLYTLERLLKNGAGDIAHPNAARYLLYMVQTEMEKKRKSAEEDMRRAESALELYHEDADDTATFDIKSTKKAKEKNLDELCAAEQASDKTGILSKWGNKSDIYEVLNEVFPDYYRNIEKLSFAIAEQEAYKIGLAYVRELSKEFEDFFDGFASKVSGLLRKQDDLVDSLRFTKGDSVYHVCSTGKMLMELSRSTRKAGEEGSMLDNELNGKIFDAVKANVRFEREISNVDVVEEDKRQDIFNDILIEYFKKDVRRRCDNIDLNVIEAIAMEKRLDARIKQREENEASDKKEERLFDTVTAQDVQRYILEMIEKGRRLAAPGIQRITNEEAREIRLIAYNKVLGEMRNYRVQDLIPNGEAVDTVSKYDLHFFNALYNLTPDKLKKFAAPKRTETGLKGAGLYHKAYFNYSRHIGPDSRKNMMISTHIDKRWDSVAAMPEMDFNFLARRMRKIHKSMIYGLVYQAIKFVDISTNYNCKRVYKYENSDQRLTEMVVSNGTLCDEFYEILDSLYISPAMVEDIDIIRAHKSAQDEVRNANYNETVFANAVNAFRIYIDKKKQDIEEGMEAETFADEEERYLLHDGLTSLLEIPVVYYNSLPNSQRFFSEMSALIDAVIDVFSDEIKKTESADDAKFLLCDKLKEQFTLLIENFNKYEVLSKGKPVKENAVIDLIYRKIRNIYETTPEPDDYQKTLMDMRKQILSAE